MQRHDFPPFPFLQLPVDALAAGADEARQLLLRGGDFIAELLGQRQQAVGEAGRQWQERRLADPLLDRRSLHTDNRSHASATSGCALMNARKSVRGRRKISEGSTTMAVAMRGPPSRKPTTPKVLLRTEQIECHFLSVGRQDGGAHAPALDAVKRIARLAHMENDLALAIAAHAAEAGQRLHIGAVELGKGLGLGDDSEYGIGLQHGGRLSGRFVPAPTVSRSQSGPGLRRKTSTNRARLKMSKSLKTKSRQGGNTRQSGWLAQTSHGALPGAGRAASRISVMPCCAISGSRKEASELRKIERLRRP